MEIWRISSYSGANNNCVEVGWRKPSRSGPNNNCVEVGFAVKAVAVRDTKDRDGARLEFAPSTWRSFLTALKHDTDR